MKSEARKAAAEPQQPVERVCVQHGHYLIVGGRRNAENAAIGYLGNKRMAAASAESVEAAVEKVRSALDEHAASLRSERVDGVPTEAEYREALVVLYPKLSKPVAAALGAHTRLPQSSTTLRDLASRLGSSERSLRQGYAKLARGMGTMLAFEPAADGDERVWQPLLSLAFVVPQREGSDPLLTLRPELLAALRKAEVARNTRRPGT